jgi:hypothetical protein
MKPVSLLAVCCIAVVRSGPLLRDEVRLPETDRDLTAGHQNFSSEGTKR